MIREYINYIRVNRGYSECTCKAYENDLRMFCEWLKEGNRVGRWSDVTDTIVNDYVSDLVMQELKPATIHRKVSAIRSMYNWARQQHKTDKNPARYVSTPKLPKRLPEVVEGQTIHAAVYDKSIDHQTRGIIAIMAETGCRIGEVLSMTGRDVNMAEYSIRIVGKGNKERKVYFGAVSHNYFTKHLKEGQLFNTEDREQRFRIHEALAKHSARHQGSSHQLRHTFATKMVEGGVQLATLAVLMGHASITTTEKYLAIGNEHVRTEYVTNAPRI